MAIVGLNITKIDAQRKEAKAGKVSVNNNVSITGVEPKDLSLGSSKQKGLRFDFEFKCEYEPGVGKINLEGNVMFLTDADKVKAVKESWDKNKNVPADVMEPILNAALNRCNIETIKLSQDINLPSPIPMPRLQKSAEPPKKKAK